MLLQKYEERVLIQSASDFLEKHEVFLIKKESRVTCAADNFDIAKLAKEEDFNKFNEMDFVYKSIVQEPDYKI